MRRQYLEELLEQTKRQRTFLFHDNYEEYIHLLEERQVLIDAIEKMRSEECPFTIEEKEIILEIKNIEEANWTEYMRQLEEAKTELRKLNELERREAQYVNPYGSTFSSGMYFDQSRR